MGNNVRDILFINYFFERTNIFRENCENPFLKGITIFKGTGRRTSKMNVNFLSQMMG